MGRWKLSIVCALALSALWPAMAANEDPSAKGPAAQNDPSGQTLDLSGYQLTFSEDFDGPLDVSPWGCGTRWIAHTPWAGDFGFAKFVDPGKDHPFIVRDGVLQIVARKERDGRWTSGLLSSGNRCDESAPKNPGGFMQRHGYFEMRARMPRGPGFWPAFWLIGKDRSRYTAELDIIEHHGGFPDRFETTLHVHARAADVEPWGTQFRKTVRAGELADAFNTFGVDVGAEEMVFYFNRREYWRTPMREEFDQPLYILVNLAMDEGYVTPETPDRAVMDIDYIRVYARKPE